MTLLNACTVDLVSFRTMIEGRPAEADPLESIPDEHLPLIGKLVQERYVSPNTEDFMKYNGAYQREGPQDPYFRNPHNSLTRRGSIDKSSFCCGRSSSQTRELRDRRWSKGKFESSLRVL